MFISLLQNWPSSQKNIFTGRIWPKGQLKELLTKWSKYKWFYWKALGRPCIFAVSYVETDFKGAKHFGVFWWFWRHFVNCNTCWELVQNLGWFNSPNCKWAWIWIWKSLLDWWNFVQFVKASVGFICRARMWANGEQSCLKLHEALYNLSLSFLQFVYTNEDLVYLAEFFSTDLGLLLNFSEISTH